ncbi:MAG: glycoside hydrolase family 2 protein [Bacteroidales bacterium]|nr:glycoside hydrolase family 2 protein [Bacteroidales bacterium]
MNIFKNFILLCICTFLIQCSTQPDSDRITKNFNKGWKFSLNGSDDAKSPDFDDSRWRVLDLPHDWSIEGEFSKDNKAGVGGGALPGGTGWYRKKFNLPESDRNRELSIEFDGIYRNSDVWINGNFLGNRPNGYISFSYDLTPYLNYGRKPNIIAVKVNNSDQPNSRWYSGSGIYRNVRLVSKSRLHIRQWGSHITTSKIDSEDAGVKIITSIHNSDKDTLKAVLSTSLHGPYGQIAAEADSFFTINPGESKDIEQNFKLFKPELWSVSSPLLYKAVSDIELKNIIVDSYTTNFGVRSFSFDSEKGFFLNGESMKIKGVCLHHDLGCLGAAINTRAIERQLEILKDMGCNAIRTSHNPPAPELLDLCDKMGFLVMDEAFDMWKVPKTQFDYSIFWDEWHKQDLIDQVLRDRNHPGVIIWSIGNEIMEQWNSSGTPIAKELCDIVRLLDNTRPITSACQDPVPGNYIIASDALDLIGYNYKHNLFKDFPVTFPGKKFIATETTSALATRGHYDMPVDSIRRWPIRWDKLFTEGNPDLTCSSYDNCSTPWGSTHSETLDEVMNYDFLSGMFVWTGFDYLGEPTPYDWPARSSYFGIVDLAGFPKDAYYLYKSVWTNEPVLHLLPHWNWKEGQNIDVVAYTNCKEAELFLNDKSLGKKIRDEKSYSLMWNVPFEKGRLEVKAITEDNQQIGSSVTTASEPARILLVPDRNQINSASDDLSFIRVEVLDSNGVLVPDASNEISFTVSGNGYIAGVDNGLQTSMEMFKSDHRKAFNGLCLVVVGSKPKPGEITVRASSPGLDPAKVVIMAN